MQEMSKFESLINDVPVIMYVVERGTFKILYLNDETKRNPRHPKVGLKCIDVWKGAECCKRCPIKKLYNGLKTYTETGLAGTHGTLDITATEIMWDGIPAYAIMAINHKLSEDEKISVAERDYLIHATMQVYPMIVTVNMTSNTYKMLAYENFENTSASLTGSFDNLIQIGFNAMHPDFKIKFIEKFGRENILRQFAKGKKELYMEHRQLGNDGKYHWTSTHVLRMDNNSNGDIIQIILCRTIDELKHAKARNDEFIKGVSALFDECVTVNTADDSFVIRESFGFIQTIAKGVSYSKFVETFSPFIHPDDLYDYYDLLLLDNIRQHISTGAKRYQCQIRRKDFTADGSYRWVRMVMVVLDKEESEEQKVFIISHDVDEFAIAKIEQNSANLRFIHAVSDMYDKVLEARICTNKLYMWKNDDDGVTKIKISDSIDDYTTLVANTLIHPDYRQMYLDTLLTKHVLSAYTSGQKEFRFEVLRDIGNSIYHWFSMQAQFIEEDSDDITLMFYLKDIDETKRAEQEKQQVLIEALNYAEKANNFKTDFLSRMSHDIRTPMNAIIGMTNIARENLVNATKLDDCLNKIDVSSKYLLTLINDILDMSKIEQGKMEFNYERFNIHEFMDNIYICCSAQTGPRNQNLTIFVDDEIESEYIGDSLKLNKIIMNLLSNACKFTAEGGDISVSLNIIEENQTTAVICFEVEDNGIGISSENIDKIFEPFEQVSQQGARNFEGSGLGLSIARSLTHMMNGHISVKSELNKGTKFIVDIPFARTDTSLRSTIKKQINVCNDYVFNGECILVAEDNEINMEIMINILEAKGLTFETAVNGFEAVKLIAENPEFKYQAILMDIRMPVMDGLEATRMIRRLPDFEYTKTLPIIAMTANAFREEMEKAKQCGVNEYLIKPIDINLFTETMYRALYINNYDTIPNITK